MIAKDIKEHPLQWERHDDWLVKKTNSLSSVQIKLHVFNTYPYEACINGCVDKIGFINGVIIGAAAQWWLNMVNKNIEKDLECDLMPIGEWMDKRNKEVAER